MSGKKGHTAASFSLESRNPADISLLLRRAGFGDTPNAIQQAATAGLKNAINRLVDFESVDDNFTPPPNTVLTLQMQGSIAQDLQGLSTWWLGRMLQSSRSLQEKMTLFWHGHFATGIEKVRSTQLMYNQNQMFRQNAVGRFDDILLAVAKDPAMLIWLDGRRNVKAAPNENWGREMLELFSLGHGHYTEDDVHANSRAFTGWRLDPNGQAVFVPRLHDDGSKTLLGQTGNWTADDAVRIVAAHPATGPFLASKLWTFFASDSSPAVAIQSLASVYYTSNHSIREMLRTLFTLPAFYTTKTRTGHIKSPAEFVITTYRQLGLTGVDLSKVPPLLTFLGQQLFNPPNVGGWHGGPGWINAGTMLGRFNFASALTGDVHTAASVLEPQAVIAASGIGTSDIHQSTSAADAADALISSIADTLGLTLTTTTYRAMRSYLGPLSFTPAALEARVRGLVHLALISPEYQAS